jgi:hypothetical protein
MGMSDLVDHHLLVDALTAEVRKLREAVAIMLPIVEATYYDEISAYAVPGSGYNHRGQHKAASQWGYKGKAFEDFKADLKPKATP